MHRLGCLLLIAFSLIAQAEDAHLSKLRTLLIPMRSAPQALPARGATLELTLAKHELRDWVEARLSAFKEYDDPKQMEDRLNEELRQAKLFCIVRSSPNDDYSSCPDRTELGFLEEIRLKRDWSSLIVQTAVGIYCGTDESAYAYHWIDGRWQRFWQSEQNDYTEEKYAPQRLLAVLISPTNYNPGADQTDRLVFTLGREPWCSSNWHSVYMRVWRTKASYLQPKLLLEGSEFAYLGNELPKGSVGKNDLTIEYMVASLDGGVHSRPEIRHYQVNQDKAIRVDPIALSPRDFADEWLHHPWPEMSRWTEQSALPMLEKWHHRWNSVYGQFIFPTLHCEDQPDLWQVGITPWLQSGEEQPPIYFLVRWRPPYHFTMIDASADPWPNCTEEDREADDAQRTLFLGDWH